MKIRVLGSSAGGGFPQWNCNCRNCRGVREGSVRAQRRTQSSLCISDDGLDWVLVNASPDLLAQIGAAPHLQPGRAVRDSGIAAVLLIDAQIDHVAGLPMLRERSSPLPVYATAQVMEALEGSLPLLPLMRHYCGVEPHVIASDGEAFTIAPLQHTRCHAVALDSKPPPYSPRRHAPVRGDNIGLLFDDRQTGAAVFYAPGLGSINEAVAEALERADLILVDGTFWRHDEMVAQGLSRQSAADMGHLPQSGPGGMIELLDRLPRARKVLIHINNTNPILDEDSPERATLRLHGIEVAFDGMEFEL
ncbi:MAG: pyrroloquinoline quinone biosynthesis protein PqqB [Betaproteobacteria bacterium]|nr:pyrroloquinoline quinone biosynthesis protein PqqB [Betaproteobacteria bacterium]MDE2123477.1 pyrroloquinoline quinone biosynthesis protein PqqB [Betaproteobacteria bacterium]MDE2185432.1 pyrroloquinoline quinone biosynthesis protein PqqB [Betaproteobacteria bacterium]MDE2323222.1 pyrroloquinoline quinone biosynthesis protein PqqB [Betaproteobacteria bacterium]